MEARTWGSTLAREAPRPYLSFITHVSDPNTSQLQERKEADEGMMAFFPNYLKLVSHDL